MANFNSHLLQAKRNLSFLSEIESSRAFDWKVTVSFYTALHLINAHIADKANLHYVTHKDLDIYLYPNNSMSLCKLDEDTFVAYKGLLNLSRRARYLLNDEKPHLNSENEHLTSEKHYKKALIKLNAIMTFMKNEYNNTFPTINITSVNIPNLDYFKYYSVSV